MRTGMGNRRSSALILRLVCVRGVADGTFFHGSSVGSTKGSFKAREC
jgi:hypothetical protein